MNLFFQNKQSTKHSVFKFSYIYGRTCVDWTSQFLIMTMRLPILTFQQRIWPKKQISMFQHPLYLAPFSLSNFFHVPKTINLFEMVSLWITWRHSEQCDNYTERTFRKWFPTMFTSIVEMFKCMYKVRRQASWKWPHSLQVSYNFYRISPLICQTSYVSHHVINYTADSFKVQLEYSKTKSTKKNIRKLKWTSFKMNLHNKSWWFAYVCIFYDVFVRLNVCTCKPLSSPILVKDHKWSPHSWHISLCEVTTGYTSELAVTYKRKKHKHILSLAD